MMFVGWIILVTLCCCGDPDPEPMAFDRDILPLLTLHGCNSGACHGAAAGRGQFHLSLFGSDPEADYEAIVYAYQGRRVRFSEPEASLLIAKPSGRIAHGGNELFDPDSDTAAKLHAWIAAGAPRGRSKTLVALKIETISDAIDLEAKNISFRAFAEFDDGSRRDVTRATQFTFDSTSEIAWNPDTASATLHRPGRHVIVARYMDRVVPVTCLHPFGSVPAPSSGAPRSVEPRSVAPSSVALSSVLQDASWIDVEIDQQLHSMGLEPAKSIDDAAWFRRVCLDLTGRLPTFEQVVAFGDDSSERRRERWIERLVSSEGFTDYWTFRMARWLGLHAIPNEPEAVQSYGRWIRDSIATDRSFQEMTRELLVSEGDSHRVGPANFSRMVGDAREHAELVSSVFMGTRLQCANCHNHPLDRWTQDDYHGLAAIFAGVDRGRMVRLEDRGQVTNLRTKEPAIPRIPGVRYLMGEEPSQPARIKIEAFTEWLLEEDNPHFAHAMVNRLWHATLGRGLVEPVDDLRATNPPSHPELLDRLAQYYRDSGFRLRPILSEIVASQVYARACSEAGNTPDSSFFATGAPRLMQPEVLLDAVHDVLGVPILDDASGGTTRSILWIDPSMPQPSLDALGRCSKGQGCDNVMTNMGLASQLHWLNGEVVNDALHSKTTFFDILLAADASDQTILTHAYLRAYGRYPDTGTLDAWRESIPSSREERRAWYQDWMWSVLSSSEFLTNH